MVILTASSGGLFPMPIAPAYATAKAGLVHFTRSLAPRLHKHGIRLCTLCPQQVDTALVSRVFICLAKLQVLLSAMPAADQHSLGKQTRAVPSVSGWLPPQMVCPQVSRWRACTGAALC